MNNTLARDLGGMAAGIVTFLKKWAQAGDGEAHRCFYGETFTLALLSMTGSLDPQSRKVLLGRYTRKDRSDPEFHWEFNNYALLRYYGMSADQAVLPFLTPLHFKNTPCTNWTLLRSVSRLLARKEISAALREARSVLTRRQLASGLILDERRVRSFQYHAFSLAMTGELYRLSDDPWYLERFRRGTAFIRRFILPNGDFNYIGRGQYQSFGYGALIYALALAFTLLGDDSLLGDIDSLLSYLKRFRQPDGSFPLVLNGTGTTIPPVVDMRDPGQAGWYPYNNYFDYLPALGFFLSNAQQLLVESGAPGKRIVRRPQESYRDGSFIKVVTDNYIAVLARPGGYWSNDMPMPYLYHRGRSLTPCCGGEQFQESLYDLRGIPLPYDERTGISLRQWSLSFFSNNTLRVLSPFGILERTYHFGEGEVRVRSRIRSPLGFRHRYLFRKDFSPASVQPGTRASLLTPPGLVPAGIAYSASGELESYADPDRAGSTIIYRLP